MMRKSRLGPWRSRVGKDKTFEDIVGIRSSEGVTPCVFVSCGQQQGWPSIFDATKHLIPPTRPGLYYDSFQRRADFCLPWCMIAKIDKIVS